VNVDNLVMRVKSLAIAALTVAAFSGEAEVQAVCSDLAGLRGRAAAAVRI
jgi:hypothetical protein